MLLFDQQISTSCGSYATESYIALLSVQVQYSYQFYFQYILLPRPSPTSLPSKQSTYSLVVADKSFPLLLTFCWLFFINLTSFYAWWTETRNFTLLHNLFHGNVRGNKLLSVYLAIRRNNYTGLHVNTV